MTDVLADPALFKRFLVFVEAAPAAAADDESPKRKDSRSTTSDSAFDLDEFGAPKRRRDSRESGDSDSAFGGDGRLSSDGSKRLGSWCPPPAERSSWLRRGSRGGTRSCSTSLQHVFDDRL